LTKETALSTGSITPARQEPIAAGLILPLAGALERGATIRSPRIRSSP
jgi:hypothetical protein